MDEQAWYYLQNDQQLGPISESALAQKFGSGELDGETPVWCETLTEWIPGSKVPQFRDAPRPAAVVSSGPRLKPRTPPPQPAVKVDEPEVPSGEESWKPKRVGLKEEAPPPPPPEETGLKKWFKRKPKTWRKDQWKPTGGFKRAAQLVAGFILVAVVFGGGGYFVWYYYAWEDLVIPGEKFRVRMPRNPEKSDWSFTSPYGEIFVVQWESHSKVSNTRYGIAYATVPQVKGFDDRALMMAARLGLTTRVGGEPHDNISYYPFLGFSSIDFISYTSKGVTDSSGNVKLGVRIDGIKAKAVYVNTQSRLYLMWSNGHYGSLGPPETDFFFESFRLLD